MGVVASTEQLPLRRGYESLGPISAEWSNSPSSQQGDAPRRDDICNHSCGPSRFWYFPKDVLLCGVVQQLDLKTRVGRCTPAWLVRLRVCLGACLSPGLTRDGGLGGV